MRAPALGDQRSQTFGNFRHPRTSRTSRSARLVAVGTHVMAVAAGRRYPRERADRLGHLRDVVAVLLAGGKHWPGRITSRGV